MIFHPAIVAANCEKLRSPGHKLGDAILTKQNFEDVKHFYLSISVMVLVMVLTLLGQIGRQKIKTEWREMFEMKPKAPNTN